MTTMTSTLMILLAQSLSEQEKQTTMTTVTPSDVSKARNSGAGYDVPWELLLVGIGTTLVIIVAISLRRRWRNRHANPSPLVLYTAIARKAGLGWRDRLLLWRMARTFNLPSPITLLLAQGTLRHYTDLYLNHRPGLSHRRAGARLARIESDLFL